jgi:prolyl-tRNA editing enzyme YbaK/EbsC (Cys-tRNA(Pro) deacylase)
MRLVDGSLSDHLSGFEHNAVTPLGMRTPMPMLIHTQITQLPDRHFWLGGGEVDLKLRIGTDAFLAHFKPAVADICM